MKQTRWIKQHVVCPEGLGESELFLEWRLEEEQEEPNSIYRNNPHLADLSGGECQGSCWEKITVEKA